MSIADLMWFVIRRLIWMALTIWIVFTSSFLLLRSMPGGPFDGEKAVPAAILRNLERRYHLDDPLYKQYGSELWRVVRLDFGPSMKLSDFSVNDVLAQGFPVSASLGIFALTFAIGLGTTAGVVSAVWRHSIYGHVLMAIATLGIAVPNFVLASLAIITCVFMLDLFPAAGWGSLGQLVLPAICLGAPFAAYVARLTRTGMLEVLGLDYIRTAYAKGLTTPQVVIRHALRGALLPVVTYLGPASAGVLTGSLVVERIFSIPGMGSHFVEAALQRDYPLAMGALLAYTVLLQSMNLLVDISYAFIDPRTKLK